MIISNSSICFSISPAPARLFFSLKAFILASILSFSCFISSNALFFSVIDEPLSWIFWLMASRLDFMSCFLVFIFSNSDSRWPIWFFLFASSTLRFSTSLLILTCSTSPLFSTSFDIASISALSLVLLSFISAIFLLADSVWELNFSTCSCSLSLCLDLLSICILRYVALFCFILSAISLYFNA